MLEVRSKSHAYAVHVGGNLLAQTGALVGRLPLARPGSRCAIVTDDRVAPLYAGAVQASLRDHGFLVSVVTVPAGERSKSMPEAARVADRLVEAGLDRHGFLVALGGGVVGDLAGFVASIYYRGIPFVQIPTTIVAQVDSAIGGKTGVNTVGGKNLLGAFHPPSLVLADIDTLATLPEREFNEGFAEVIKHGVIRDRALLVRLSGFQRADSEALASIIQRNLEIKAAIVAEDEFERTGQRALLNFGHTLGHAIEQAAGYGRYLHGEAISLGMVAAGRLSMEKAGLDAAESREMVGLLERFGLPTILPGDLSTPSILESMAKDKKFEAGQIRFVLTPKLGEAFVSKPDQIGRDDLVRVVESLRRHA